MVYVAPVAPPSMGDAVDVPLEVGAGGRVRPHHVGVRGELPPPDGRTADAHATTDPVDGEPEGVGADVRALAPELEGQHPDRSWAQLRAPQDRMLSNESA